MSNDDKELALKLGLSLTAALIVYVILSKVLTRIGLIKDSTTDSKARKLEGSESPLNVLWFDKNVDKNRKARSYSKREDIVKIANAIYDDGYQGLLRVNTNVAALFNIFKKMENKIEVWQVAKVFSDTKGLDLQTFLNNSLTDNDMAKLYDVIESKPTY